MKTLIVTSGAIILLAMLLVASAGLAERPVHQVSGGGTVEYAGARNTHAFNARIEADGDVRGQAEFQLRYTDLAIHVEISCLTVVGNNAWLGGTITTSSDPALEGQQVFFRVQDNGEGRAAADRTSQAMIGVTIPPCTTTPPLGLLSWENGNVQVK